MSLGAREDVRGWCALISFWVLLNAMLSALFVFLSWSARLQARAQQLQDALDECAVDIRKYKEDLQAYEKQCQST